MASTEEQVAELALPSPPDETGGAIVEFAKVLEDAGVLAAPAKLAELEKAYGKLLAQNAMLKAELEETKKTVAQEIVASNAKYAKKMKRLIQRIGQLALSKTTRNITATKGPDGWFIRVDSSSTGDQAAPDA